MRVGLLSPATPETLGGGHTIEEEIFERLLAVAPSTKHEFFVFDWDGRTDSKTDPSLSRVALSRPLPTRIKLKTRALSQGFAGSSIAARLWEEEWLQRLIAQSKIDFFLNIKPGTLTVEIPFLTIVWDLQHRLQPFFPEVSANGELEARDYLYSHTLPRATFVIAGTEAGKKEIEQFYGVAPERIRILPHPTPRFALEAPASNWDDLAQFSLPPNYVFYPAQFWPHKNHVGLLRALAYLKEKEGISLPAVFVGADKGNAVHVRNEASRLGLKEQVYFLGHVSRPALCALYRNALALCYASFFGPENMPPLEAFALGCPVVAAEVPGASEQLGDAVIRVSPTNQEEMAEALQSLLQDPAKRATLIARGKERAHRFTGEHFAKGLIALLDEFESVRRCWN